MTKLIRREVLYYRDQVKWVEQEQREQVARDALSFAADNWDRIQFISTEEDWSDGAWDDHEEPDEDEDDE